MASSSLLHQLQAPFHTSASSQVLMDDDTPPPSRPSPQGTSRLAQMQARFQQRQLQEKEAKLLQMLESQQQRTIQRVSGRGSAGSSTSSNSSSTSSSPASSTGKVRLLFEERRAMQNTSGVPRRAPVRSGPPSTTGWDRSYPLDPLSKSAGVRSTRPNVPKPTTTVKKSTDLDVSLRPIRSTRDANANLSPNDDLPTMFGKLANVGFRNGVSNNNNHEEDINDAPTTRKPIVKSLAEPKIRPAPAKRISETMKSPTAAVTRPSPTIRRATPPSPIRSNASSATGSSATSPEPLQKPSSASSRRGSAGPNPAPSAGPIPPGMAECPLCGRRFNEDRISKHEDICRKTKSKKRKTFDPVKMRVQGTEVESYLKKTGKKPGAATTVFAAKKPPADAKKSNWRKKHEEFIESIRSAKKFQQHIAAGGKASDLPPPKPMDTSDYVQCPHCNRKFSEGAAERHIPRCANIKSNKPAPTRAPPRKR